MQENYLYIILIVLVVAAALLFVWMRRDRALPEERSAETLPADPVAPDRQFPAPPDVRVEESVMPSPGAGDRAVPEAEAAPLFAPAADAGPPDALTTIKGLGPKAAARLADLGITRFDQLADLTGDRLAAVDAQMGPLQGRIAKDRWVEQAGFLATGNTAGFEATFGKLGG